jgi:hypothetical protein
MSNYEKYLTEAVPGGVEKGMKTIFKRKFGIDIFRTDVKKTIEFTAKQGIDPQEFEDLDKLDAIEDMLRKAYGKDAIVDHDFNKWTVRIL